MNVEFNIDNDFYVLWPTELNQPTLVRPDPERGYHLAQYDIKNNTDTGKIVRVSVLHKSDELGSKMRAFFLQC